MYIGPQIRREMPLETKAVSNDAKPNSATLTSSSGRYLAATHMLRASQARALAEAGLEDARVKLQRDCEFPPASSMEQPLYCYAEKLGGAGVYQVRIDSTHRGRSIPVAITKLRNSSAPAAGTSYAGLSRIKSGSPSFHSSDAVTAGASLTAGPGGASASCATCSSSS